MKNDVAFRSIRKIALEDLADIMARIKITTSVERIHDVVAQRQGYLVTCSVRLRAEGIPMHAPGAQPASYDNYPALVINQLSLNGLDPSEEVELLHYSPKTLNSSTQSTRTGGSSENTGAEIQHTTGSSISTTNTYGANIQLGMQGEVPTGDIGGHFDHSDTAEQSQSDLSGTSHNLGVDASASTTVTIKDWASFASVSESTQNVRWWWGQESPWNVIRYHGKITDTDKYIALPEHVAKLLTDNNVVLPPSELAMFGIDFTSQARWLVTSKNGARFDSALTITCEPVILLGTHGLTQKSDGEAKVFFANLKKTSRDFPAVDCVIDSLAKLAIAPIGTGDALTGAVNFLVSPQFSRPDKGAAPAASSAPSSRSFVSASNEVLLVASKEFADDMSVTIDAKTAPTLRVIFKIDERHDNVNLALRCWKAGEPNVSVLVSVSADKSPQSPKSFWRHVDWEEAGSVTKSVLSIDLRNRDYFSDECCDFLQYGTNVVDMKFHSTTGEAVTLFLRALAVG